MFIKSTASQFHNDIRDEKTVVSTAKIGIVKKL